MHLRRRRVFPINHLPNELLGHVFFFWFHYEPPLSSIYPLPPYPVSIGWVKVTHVCRHWREVALNCPQLWSEISLYMGREWTRKMIARAKQAPLDIYSGNEAGNLLALVVPGHLSHTKSLNISDVDLNVVHSLTAAAPILERLTLYSTMADGNPVLSLPEDIFAFHAPPPAHSFFQWVQGPLVLPDSTKRVAIEDCHSAPSLPLLAISTRGFRCTRKYALP